MKNQSLLAFIIFFQCQLAFSQAELPPVKDPRVEAFTIFGDIPVSHTTGVPDISIPLFNIESHGYTLPVTLRYHTALVKPPFDHTNVATGWILEVGGNIVQTNNNADDFLDRKPATWKNDYDLLDPNVESTWLYTHMAVSESYDCEHDIFSYSFPGSNGQFIVNKNSTGKYDAISLSDPNLKGTISVTSMDYSYTVNDFVLKDSRGYNYRYIQKSYSGAKNPFYMLNKVSSPNGLELFNFEYKTGYNNAHNFLFQQYSFPDYWHVIARGGGAPCYEEEIPPVLGSYSYWFSRLLEENLDFATISRVGFDNGSLNFTLGANKQYITSISLNDANGNTIKKVEFQIGNFPGAGYRYLDKIILKDKNSAEISEYSFDYYNKGTVVNDATLNIDYWGYLNSGSRGPAGYIDIASKTFSYTDGKGLPRELTLGFNTNRQPDLLAQTYALKSITYPTKGKTEFAYELNQYIDKFDNTTKTGGGLRIENITNFDENNNQVSVKTYRYEPGSADFSFLNDYDNIKESYSIQGVSCSNGGIIPGWFITTVKNKSFDAGLINPAVSKSILYSKVTEFSGTPTDNIGKTTYEYEYSNSHVYGTSEWFAWRYVSEYRNWDNGQLKKKTVFKNNSGAYDTISTENLTYTKADLQSFDNVKFFNYANYGKVSVGENYAARYDLINLDGISQDILPPPYIPYNYTIKAGAIRLTSKVTTLYNSDGTRVSTAESFNYDKGFDKFLTSSKVTNSNSKVTKTFFKYPYDVSSDVTNEMVARNIFSPVLEETSEVESLKIKGTKTTYGFLNTDGSLSASGSQAFILPSEIYELDRNANFYKKYTYDKYNSKGNLLQYHKEDDINTSFIWGYNQALPVIKAENLDITELNTAVGLATSNLESLLSSLGDMTTDEQKGLWKSFNTTLRNGISKTSLITAYTYSPLVGMTSSTDPSGVTTYYEYDTFARLKLIKDDKGKILKIFDYHYKQ
jgi:YD repeat-containing protein